MAGRHKYQPSDEHRRQVMALSGYGIPQVEIATLIACDTKTLRKYYRTELDTGATRANAAVAQSLYGMATRDKVPSAAIFWLKARAGWREAADLNVSGNGSMSVIITTGVPQPDPPKPFTIEYDASEDGT